VDMVSAKIRHCPNDQCGLMELKTAGLVQTTKIRVKCLSYCLNTSKNIPAVDWFIRT